MKNLLKKLAILIVVALFAAAAYYLYDQFRERSVNERMAEIVHDEDRRVVSDKLKGYLDDPSPEVRARAAMALGRIGGQKAADLLFGMISDESIDLAGTAGLAMGLTHQSQYAGRLLDVALDLPSSAAAKVIASVGRLVDSSTTGVTERLAEFLDHPSPDVREAICYALLNAKAKAQAPLLIKHLKSESDDLVRAAGLYALARMEIAQANDLFVDNLADTDPFVRQTCVRGLGRSGSSKVLHLLQMSLNDSDPNVVAEAVNELSRSKDKKAKDQLAKRVESGWDEKLMGSLMDGLRLQENNEAVQTTWELLETVQPANVTAAAAVYLASRVKDKAVNLLDSLAAEPDPFLRKSAAEGYALIARKNVIPRLAGLFNDDDPWVRAAAFAGLLKIDKNNQDYYIKKALADPDWVLQTLAVDHIQSARLSSYLPQLSGMMATASVLEIDLRRSLVQVARAFLDQETENADATLILMNSLMDSEYIVRREAAIVYKDVLGEDRFGIVPPAPARIEIDAIHEGFKKYQPNPYAVIGTSKGDVELELFYDVAPLTVLNFIELAKSGLYDGLVFHRVVPGFVVQGGDPRGDGWGGPPWQIRCEYSGEPYQRGTVGIATSGQDTGGSQFFITLSPQPRLEARYTVFGQVTAGMEVVDQIVRGDLIQKIVIQEG
ncbi:MAG: peptidylprolyl isomerase [candidate division Zixibacteria bacterium]|nr:peptidylprolyl isomerase [candidate division Zixibacteria bacterium]MDH3938225.1 peptidylprolyl isomerase [candidate division Zixibacteria bacterium]MDH4032911.1 peptidylprolyl isomerase [candidate division Zixibacteria bacterium]